jgi:hypothetical protein
MAMTTAPRVTMLESQRMSSDEEMRDYDRRPESLSGSESLFEKHRSMFLDIATERGLTGDGGQDAVRLAVTTIATHHAGEIAASGMARSALVLGEATAIESELERRNEVAKGLVKDYEIRRRLREAKADAIAKLVEAETQLLVKRKAAEDDAFAKAIAELKADEAEAMRRSLEIDTAADERASTDSLPTESHDGQITELRRRRAELAENERRVFEREEKLRDRWITKSLAGFLVWLGYASVVATGTVLALIMGGPKALQFGALIEGWHGFVGSIVPSWPIWARVLIALALVLLLLMVVALAVALCDKVLRRLWKWGEEKTRPDSATGLTPRALSPKSHMQLVAVMPYVLVAGILLTILVASPDVTAAVGAIGESTVASQSRLLASLFPTVGFTFIGIAIAFLATAVFVMYVVQVVEPRASEKAAVLRTAWEFVLPPLVLILACALTPLALNVELSVWTPWAAFMLLSSLSLACGLVYHGIFKDAAKARARITRLDRRIARLSGLPSDEGEDDGDNDVKSLFSAELVQLQRARRQSRLIPLGVQPSPAATGSGSDGIYGKTRAWLLRSRSPVYMPQTPAPGALPWRRSLLSGYHPVDSLVGSDLVVQIQSAEGRLAMTEETLRDVERTIVDRERIVSAEAISELHRRKAVLRAIADSIPHRQKELQLHASIAKEIMLLQIDTADGSARSAKPFVDGIRNDLSSKVPFCQSPQTSSSATGQSTSSDAPNRDGGSHE